MTFSSDLGERQYASQYGTPTIGFVVHSGGVPTDADANSVTVRMESLDGQTILFDRPADHPATGTYETTLLSSETSSPGIYKVTWSYHVGGTVQTYVGLVEVGESSPDYDRLDDGMKALVESVWVRFADLFDSPDGGPHLQVYFQSRFGRGRMAQLLGTALRSLNVMAQPHTTYTIESVEQGGKGFPLEAWGGVLESALYIEAIKHLIRSYVEQPEPTGVNVARLDRRDYMQRWQAVLDMERRDFEEAKDHFKIAHMGLGRPRVLVSGGVYGTYGPTRVAGSQAARPRYWTAWY